MKERDREVMTNKLVDFVLCCVNKRFFTLVDSVTEKENKRETQIGTHQWTSTGCSKYLLFISNSLSLYFLFFSLIRAGFTFSVVSSCCYCCRCCFKTNKRCERGNLWFGCSSNISNCCGGGLFRVEIGRLIER